MAFDTAKSMLGESGRLDTCSNAPVKTVRPLPPFGLSSAHAYMRRDPSGTSSLRIPRLGINVMKVQVLTAAVEDY